ncbi:Periphilin-1 [Fukomys damarensis]|uniref:Periphilin-1 n=1 Tax=Fukomys damarensis TaxID=885580 RepID=A0A091D535_FUKDA|nr:Periphilin-1 [Fukomys damarensis]
MWSEGRYNYESLPTEQVPPQTDPSDGYHGVVNIVPQKPPLLDRPGEESYSRYHSHVGYQEYVQGCSFSHDRRSGPPHGGVLDKPSRLTEKEFAEATSRWAAEKLQKSEENSSPGFSEFQHQQAVQTSTQLSVMQDVTLCASHSSCVTALVPGMRRVNSQKGLHCAESYSPTMALDARPRALLLGALNSPKGLQDAGTYSSARFRELSEQRESPRKEHSRLVGK